jgi:hypothetical protein
MENNETEITITNEEVSSNQELRSDVPEGSKSVLSKMYYKETNRKIDRSILGGLGQSKLDISTVCEIFLRSSSEHTKILLENCQFNRLKKLVVPRKGLGFKKDDMKQVIQSICSWNKFQKECEKLPNSFFEEISYTRNKRTRNGYYKYFVQSVKDYEEGKGKSINSGKIDNKREQMIFQYTNKGTPFRMVVDVPDEFEEYEDHLQMIMDKMSLNPSQYLLKGFEEGILTSKITEEPDHTILLIESSDEEDRFDWLENVLDEINSTIPSKKFHLEYDCGEKPRTTT